jgi:hypothetical protein
MISRARQLQVLSTPESLDALDDETFNALEQRRAAQRSPVLYQVTQLGEPDGGYIDSVHAKVLLIEHAGRTATFIGSANATGRGWGLGDPVNVEAMVEMRPGIGVDRFVSSFLRENKTKVHPWIVEYDRAARSDADSEREAERQLLAALRQVARMDLELFYDAESESLTVKRTARRAISLGNTYPDITFDFAPLLLTDRGDIWTPVQQLASGRCRFDAVALDKLTAFVAIRARSAKPALERIRLLLGRLNVSDAELDERDALVRQEIMATANPTAVLNALVRGLAYAPGTLFLPEKRNSHTSHTLSRLLHDANLERLLQAVALEPALVSEMKLLLGAACGAPFQRFCDDLEAVIARVHAEAVP